jgi:hypothetical protein
MNENELAQLVKQRNAGEIDQAEYERRLAALFAEVSEEAKTAPDQMLRKARIRKSGRIARSL